MLFGDEDHLINQALFELKSNKTREIVFFDGDGLDAYDVVDLCETRTGYNRAAIIDNAQKVTKNADVLLRFIEGRDPEDKSVFLMVVVRGTALKGAWVKAASERGRTVSYLKPKPWETEKQIARIQEEAKRAKVRLGKEVPELLLKVLGYDLALIANELGKASYLVGDQKVVGRDDILALIPHVFPTQPWEVAEAAASKRPKQALNLLGFVYRNLGDGASIPVAYALMRLVEKLLVARNLSDRGASTKEVADRLGMHEYAYKMNLLPLVRRHEVPRLADQMRTLCRLDSVIKGAASSKRTHVELAVLALAT